MIWAATMLVSPTQAAGFIIQVWTQRRDLQPEMGCSTWFGSNPGGSISTRKHNHFVCKSKILNRFHLHFENHQQSKSKNVWNACKHHPNTVNVHTFGRTNRHIFCHFDPFPRSLTWSGKPRTRLQKRREMLRYYVANAVVNARQNLRVNTWFLLWLFQPPHCLKAWNGETVLF